jgi:transcriptional regulator with XRE-family HTH domain
MNKNRDQFEKLLDEVRENPKYDAEMLCQTFADQLWTALDAAHLRQADIARSAGVSRQFLTRVFQGKRNLTLKTIAKLAHAANLRAHLHLAPAQVECEWQHFWKEDPRQTFLNYHFKVKEGRSYTLTALSPDQRNCDTADNAILTGDFDVEETHPHKLSKFAAVQAHEEIGAAA